MTEADGFDGFVVPSLGSGYERPDPATLFGEAEAERLFGLRELCPFCERTHRPRWVFSDCLNLQGHAMLRWLDEMRKTLGKLQ